MIKTIIALYYFHNNLKFHIYLVYKMSVFVIELEKKKFFFMLTKQVSTSFFVIVEHSFGSKPQAYQEGTIFPTQPSRLYH